MFVYMVRELMEEGEGVQRLVQVTNLTKDSFLFLRRIILDKSNGLVLGVRIKGTICKNDCLVF